MNTAIPSANVLRSKLHNCIERADERHLEAIYVLVEGAEQDAAHGYKAATMAMLHERRDLQVKGTSNSYTCGRIATTNSQRQKVACAL